MVLFWDDLPLGDALVGPSLRSHDEHTDSEVYLCQVVHVSPRDLVLCFGYGGFSHLPGVLLAFILVVF